jgi:hypothetical protein
MDIIYSIIILYKISEEEIEIDKNFGVLIHNIIFKSNIKNLFSKIRS